MKNILLIVIVAITFQCFIFGQKKRADSRDYKISLKTDKEEYSLGEPIIVDVNYYNGSDKIWTLYRPDSSYHCSISYIHVMKGQQDFWNGHAFNKCEIINDFTDCPGCGYAVALTGDKIILEPKEKYEFKTDIMEGVSPEEVLPGQIYITFHDAYEQINSDTIHVCIRFTNASTGFLLNRMENEKVHSATIDWAKEILVDIYPAMKQYKYNSNYQEGIIYYTDDQKSNNEQLLKDFLNYCEQNKGSDEMKVKIHKINTNLGKYYFIDMNRAKHVKQSCIKYD